MTRNLIIAITAFLATATFAQQRFPNSTKYRDTGLHDAHATAGAASITARALLGSDNITTLEVTTGTFDGGTAPGNIDKIQLKRIVDNRTITTNDTNLADGGYYVDRLSGVLRHDVLNVQANVSGIQTGHVDVVSASETVKLRPDLQVSDLVLPATVRLNVPATISATVRELNGDLGARANCVLSVDGVAADSSPNIWVDAHGAVTCTFNTIFTTGGAHQVTVAATNVAPGDWDLANNSASAQVEVVTSGSFNRYRLNAQEIVTISRSSSTAPWSQDVAEWRYDKQFLMFTGSVEQPMNLETMTAVVQTSSDGVALDDSSSIPLERGAFYDGDLWGWGCFYGFDNATYRGVTGCGSWDRYSGTLRGYVDFTYSRESTTVTYHSYGWDQRYTNSDGSYWTWNYNSSTTTGQVQQWGNTVTLHVTLTDGDKTFEATPTVSFAPYHFEWDFGNCYTDPYTGETSCSQFQHIEDGRTGETTSGY